MGADLGLGGGQQTLRAERGPGLDHLEREVVHEPRGFPRGRLRRGQRLLGDRGHVFSTTASDEDHQQQRRDATEHGLPPVTPGEIRAMGREGHELSVSRVCLF
jgi:hypothetical protein